MDAIDRILLESLVANARRSYAELAETVGLSAPSTAERVRRLEERGVISGYAAVLEPAAVGASMTAFVSVALISPEARGPFLAAVGAEPAVVECHHVAGEDDYLLKVRCRDIAALEHLVSDVVKGVRGVTRTRTSIMLSTAFERPIGPPAE